MREDDEVSEESRAMARAIMEVIEKLDPRYAPGGEFHDGGPCKARVWDSGDKTDCGNPRPCPDHD